MISSWILQKEIEEARKEGMALALEADRTRKPGETLRQAIERVEAERDARR